MADNESLVTADQLERVRAEAIAEAEKRADAKIAQARAYDQEQIARAMSKKDVDAAMTGAFNAVEWTKGDAVLQRGLRDEVADRVRNMEDLGRLSPEQVLERVGQTAEKVAKEHAEKKNGAVVAQQKKDIEDKLKDQQSALPSAGAASGAAPPPSEAHKMQYADIGDEFPASDHKWETEEELLGEMTRSAKRYMKEKVAVEAAR